MSVKAAVLPSVKTTPEFKKRVEDACQSIQLQYSEVVIRLLQEWMTGTIEVTHEPDPDFIASAREALRSEPVQNAIQELAEHYTPRTYPHAIKAS